MIGNSGGESFCLFHGFFLYIKMSQSLESRESAAADTVVLFNVSCFTSSGGKCADHPTAPHGNRM